MGKIKTTKGSQLLSDVTHLIEESKGYVAYAANAALAMLYWKKGAEDRQSNTAKQSCRIWKANCRVTDELS